MTELDQSTGSARPGLPLNYQIPQAACDRQPSAGPWQTTAKLLNTSLKWLWSTSHSHVPQANDCPQAAHVAMLTWLS